MLYLNIYISTLFDIGFEYFHSNSNTDNWSWWILWNSLNAHIKKYIKLAEVKYKNHGLVTVTKHDQAKYETYVKKEIR